MKKINWSNESWLTRERWGELHPQKSFNWYDPKAILIRENGNLELNIHRNFREFPEHGVNSEYGTGLICSEKRFGHGFYEIEAKQPVGVGLWTAFWLYPTENWPPEIDIFEGYSKDNNYTPSCFLKKYQIGSCVHLLEGNFKQRFIHKCNVIWNGKPHESFNKYALLWTSEKLTFYVNGHIVRTITNKKALTELNKYKMQVVINNHIDPHYLSEFKIVKPFVIKYFKFEQL